MNTAVVQKQKQEAAQADSLVEVYAAAHHAMQARTIHRVSGMPPLDAKQARIASVFSPITEAAESRVEYLLRGFKELAQFKLTLETLKLGKNGDKGELPGTSALVLPRAKAVNSKFSVEEGFVVPAYDVLNEEFFSDSGSVVGSKKLREENMPESALILKDHVGLVIKWKDCFVTAINKNGVNLDGEPQITLVWSRAAFKQASLELVNAYEALCNEKITRWGVSLQLVTEKFASRHFLCGMLDNEIRRGFQQSELRKPACAEDSGPKLNKLEFRDSKLFAYVTQGSESPWVLAIGLENGVATPRWVELLDAAGNLTGATF